MVSSAFLTPLSFRPSAAPLSSPFFSSFSRGRPFRQVTPLNRTVISRVFRASASNPTPPSQTDTSPTPQPQTDASPTPLTTSQPPPFLSLLKQKKKIKVDPKSGKKVKPFQSGVEITSAKIDLPSGPVAHLGISSDRRATAVVFAPGDLADLDLSSTGFIIFAHGFTQIPENYFSLLSFLAVQGYVVIAPHVWAASLLFKSVETVPSKFGWSDVPAKLQTALLIDSARSLQIAADYTSSIHLFGHSMGGGMALVYAGHAGSAVQSIGLMAPEVGDLELTDLNQTVCLNDENGMERMRNLATQIGSKVFLLHGDRDSIVPTVEIEQVFKAFEKTPFTGFARIKRGTHVGFQDTLEIDLDWKPLKLIIMLVNLIVYGFHDILGLDVLEQLKTTKTIFEKWYEHVDDENEVIKKGVESTDNPSVVSYDWTS